MNNFYWRTWAEINLDTLKNNICEIKKIAKNKEIIAVVKANAYGHGGAEVASALSNQASMFAVALLEEGIELRYASCNKDILVFTPPLDEEETYLFCLHELITTIPDLSKFWESEWNPPTTQAPASTA